MKQLSGFFRTFWNKIGLPQPAELPRAARWAESLVTIHLTIAIMLLAYSMISKIGSISLIMSVVLVAISSLVMGLALVATLLATRRGSIIAYWVAIAYLLRPVALTVMQMVNAPESAIEFLSLPIFATLSSSLAAAIFLLHPSTKAWVMAQREWRKQQRQEKKHSR
jgi:hypothetical protein